MTELPHEFSRVRWYRFWRHRGFGPRLAWRMAKERRLLLDPDKVS